MCGLFKLHVYHYFVVWLHLIMSLYLLRYCPPFVSVTNNFLQSLLCNVAVTFFIRDEWQYFNKRPHFKN